MMKAAVIYATHFGATEKVARSLEGGLREAGIDTVALGIEGLQPASLSHYDLLCVGAPTEMFTAYKPMKDFLATVGRDEVGGKLGFAFDTRLDSRLSGSAAKYVENSLSEKGVSVTAQRESAIVSNTREHGTITGSKLKEGEEERFRQIGRSIGESLKAVKRAS